MLRRLINDKQLDGHVGGNKFEAELIKQGLFQTVKIGVLPIFSIPIKGYVNIAFDASAVNDWNLEVAFKIARQFVKRAIYE